MSLPVPPNTTCDIYEPGNAPPSAPDSASVACHLIAAYDRGLEAGEETDAGELACKFTHIMLIDAAVNTLQDGHSAAGFTAAQSSAVYVPDKDGTSFLVVFIERNHAGKPHDHKKVYLRRLSVTWPTEEL